MNEAVPNQPMPDSRKCPQCGTPLPAGALAGLCPACLLKQGAAADTATAGQNPPFNPPPIGELAALFPQLEILELVGKGGMGAVYKARQKQLDRVVALKILPPGTGDTPAFAERFAREAKALAKLNHPGIVTLYEFGQIQLPGSSGREFAPSSPQESQGRLTSAATGQGGLYFFLMEFVDGVNLRQLLQSGRVSPREALAIVPQICDALQFAHDQGIVHRDIKPENILLDRRGRVKVADFGLAKIVGGSEPLTPALSPSDGERVAVRPGEGTPALTDAGKVMGTPSYMAPEQVSHPADVDHRADIYALGVVFYQMLTGELPGKRLEPPSSKVQIDARLDEVVLRALEKKPELRYQQASVLKTQVETIATTAQAGGSLAASAPWMYRGVDYRSKMTLFGLPLVHVASGIDPATGRQRVAKGIIAIGGMAKGVVAFGGVAMGGVTFGGLSLGVVAFGGCALGLVAFGGLAIALVVALGGGAIAPIAIGGGAVGYFAYGGGAIGVHVLDAVTKDPAAEHFFRPWANVLLTNIQWINTVFIVMIIAVGVGVPLWLQMRTGRKSSGDSTPGGSRPADPQSELDDSQRRLMSARTTRRHGWLALSLFLAGTLGTLLLMTISHRDEPALIFGGVALVLAFIFGVISWREPLGKAVVVGTLVLFTGLGITVAILTEVWVVPTRKAEAAARQREAMERLKALSAQEMEKQRGSFAFSPVLAVVLTNLSAMEIADFDELGRLTTLRPIIAMPESVTNSNRVGEIEDRVFGFMERIGADFSNPGDGWIYGLTLNMVTFPQDEWDKCSPERLAESLRGSSAESRVKFGKDSPTSYTFGFKRRNGGLGLLQITGFTENPRGVKIRYKLVQTKSAASTVSRKPEPSQRKFVRLVVDKAAMTFEGQPTTWDDVAALLEKVPERKNTVLECAVTSDQITVQQQNEWFGKCSALAHSLGFEYASFIGIHPLGSKGTSPRDNFPIKASTPTTFGPVIERTINDLDEQQGNEALGLLTGKLLSLPAEMGKWPQQSRMDWLRTNQVDLLVDYAKQRWALIGFGWKVGDLSDDGWERIVPGGLEAALAAGTRLLEPRTNPSGSFHLLPTNAPTPLTLAFQTPTGDRGVLQIIGFTDNPRGVKIRYKLVQNAEKK
ncbi:MAG: serine/threonine protein kinase [Verrucomicrobia bacterium]|nr:serine/threonine protein kinase [Verrucomicrobiota bacterium]